MRPAFILTPWFPKIRIPIHFIAQDEDYPLYTQSCFALTQSKHCFISILPKPPLFPNPNSCLFLCLVRGCTFVCVSPLSKQEFNPVFVFKSGLTYELTVLRVCVDINLEIFAKQNLGTSYMTVYILEAFFIHGSTSLCPFMSNNLNTNQYLHLQILNLAELILFTEN